VRLALLILLLLGCSSNEQKNEHNSVFQDNEKWTVVATYLGVGEDTGEKVSQLLSRNGIRCIGYGSKGYSVAVHDKDAVKARELLEGAIRADGLRVYVQK
jgi:hypothetical protein